MSFSLRSRLLSENLDDNQNSSRYSSMSSSTVGASNTIKHLQKQVSSASSSNSTILIPDHDKWTNKRDYDLLDLINLSTRLTGSLTPEQSMVYSMAYRIQEITQQLKFPDKFIVDLPPSTKPLPPPVYDATGKRINTPKYLFTKSLEQERHHLIDFVSSMVSDFIPPADYKKPNNRLVEKIFIPVNEYPDINFIGLLIGPRGNTLRKLQEDSGGARIAIRGKGSVKEGKNRTTITEKQNNLEEDLHVLVITDDPKKMKKGVQLVNDVINKAVLTPEGQNDLKRGQLRELALINGTLREYEQKPCPNCGELGHNRYNCTKAAKTNSIICRICGLNGHFARDCKFRNQNNADNNGTGSSDVDREFEIMMNEINGNEPSYNASNAAITALSSTYNQASTTQPSLPAIPSQAGNTSTIGSNNLYGQSNRSNYQQQQQQQGYNNNRNYSNNYQNSQDGYNRSYNNMNRNNARHTSASPPPQNNQGYYRNQNNYDINHNNNNKYNSNHNNNYNNNHNNNYNNNQNNNYNNNQNNNYSNNQNSNYNNNNYSGYNHANNNHNSNQNRNLTFQQSYGVTSQQQASIIPPPPPSVDINAGHLMMPPPPPPGIEDMAPPPPPPSGLDDLPPPPGL